MSEYSPSKKQLPLRQQANPPTLRYTETGSSPHHRPVHLFSRNDIHSLKYGGFMPVFQNDLPSRNDVINIDSVRHATSSPTKTTDPYSRPFIPRKPEDSAVIDRRPSFENDKRFYDGARLGRVPSFVSTPNGVSTTSPTVQNSSFTNGIVQTNSFLRPQSAVRREEAHVEKPEEEDGSDSESGSDRGAPVMARDVTEARTFVLFPAKAESSYDLALPPNGLNSNRGLSPSESVTKSLQRPLSAVARSPTGTNSAAPESSPTKSILKSKENLYTNANANALKHRVKLTSTSTSPQPPPTPDKSLEIVKNELKENPPASGGAMSSTADRSSTVTNSMTNATSIHSMSKPESRTPNGYVSQISKMSSQSLDSRDSGIESRKDRIVHRPPTPRANTPTTSNIIRKSPSPSARPASAVVTSPPSPIKGQVRNPRYTPTKPYDEVKDPKPPPPKTESPSAVVKKTTNTTPLSNGKVKAEQRKEGDGAPSVTAKVETSDKANIVRDEKRQKVTTDARKEVEEVKVESRVKTGTIDSVKGGGIADEERLPGDGETSVENTDDDDDEDADGEDDESEDGDDGEGYVTETETADVAGDDDDVVDNPDDDVVDFSGDDSDGYSMTSSLSMRSGSARARVKSGRIQSAKRLAPRVHSASSTRSDRRALPGLTRSLFTGVPPTVTFVTQDERVEVLPWEIRRMLKWRLSPITPNVVKNTVARSGFRISKRNYDWIGCWGRHMKAQAFKSIRDYQKINHFPGTFQIGRKDRLWRNLYKLQLQHGKHEFGFFPQTYVLPSDLKRLKQVWDDNSKQKWIIKPPASARGIGIKVVHKWVQIPKRRPVIVQKYLAKPYLINQSKFDLRIYVYVTSYDPLRIYVFEDGLVRFASQKYSSSMKHLSNKFMHLTNYSVNKHNSEYQSNTDETVCQGHKWGLRALWGYLEERGINTKAVWASIKDVVVKSIICGESPINSLIKSSCRRRYCVHELFGFDIFLDETLKPWILEVNISPSLHSNSQLDINIKGTMIKDLMNLAGFMVPDKRDVTPSFSNGDGAEDPSNDVCINKKLWLQPLSSDEKSKHAYFVSRAQDNRNLCDDSILDILTPDDIRILIETLDEERRRGEFERVFPCPTSGKYHQYMEQPRYYNLLLDAWVRKYQRIESKGIALLDKYCQQKLHTASPTMDPAHQWVAPNQILTPRMHSAPARKPPVKELPKTSFTKKPGILKNRKSSGFATLSMSSVNSLESSTTVSRSSTAARVKSRDSSRERSLERSRDNS